MPTISITAHITINEGKADDFVSAFRGLLEQADREPGTLFYSVHRSKDDPNEFWTSEIYTDEEALSARSASEARMPRRCRYSPT